MTDPRRLAGAVAPVVALGGILIATLLDPTFSWADDALSDLGVRPRSTPVFNGSLILAGALTLPYAHLLVERAEGPVARLAAWTFPVAGICLAGVGLFDLTHPLHFPAAIGFYLLVTVVFLLDGVARRDTPTGRVTLAFVPLHLVAWWTWLLGYWPVSGLALPELLGAVLVALWVWGIGPPPTLPVRDDPADAVDETGGRTDEH